MPLDFANNLLVIHHLGGHLLLLSMTLIRAHPEFSTTGSFYCRGEMT